MLLVCLVSADAGMVASILLWNFMPIWRSRLIASVTSSTKMRHSSASAVPSPAWTMSAHVASGGVNRPPFGPTVRMVQKSALGLLVAPAPRTPGTPQRPFTASIVRTPSSCAAMVEAVAAPPPPITSTSVSYVFICPGGCRTDAVRSNRGARDDARRGRRREHAGSGTIVRAVAEASTSVGDSAALTATIGGESEPQVAADALALPRGLVIGRYVVLSRLG